MMTDHQSRVRKFMIAAGQEVMVSPRLPDESVRLLRARLILEEALETIRALGFSPGVYYPSNSRDTLPITMQVTKFLPNPKTLDIVEIADGCADLSVVTVGTLVACGIPDKDLLQLVDNSNMAKFSGDGHKDPETGKWIKPSDWQPPDIARLLNDLNFIAQTALT